MLFRILFLLIAFLLAYVVYRAMLNVIAGRSCSSCEGLGYWKGTRGEKNRCNVCNGSGKVP